MLPSLRIVSREYWKAVNIIFFNKLISNISVFNYECFTHVYRVFSVKKFKVFLWSYVYKATDILCGLLVVSVNYRSFMRILNKYMLLRSIPKGIPNCMKWNLLYEIIPVLFKMFDYFRRQIICSSVIQPNQFFFFWLEISRKFNPQSTCLLGC